MSIVGRIEDAKGRLEAAEKLLKEFDYAGAMFEAQRCIELSVKAFLDKLDINYRKIHDVSDKIPESFEKLKPYLEDYEVNSARIELARAAVLLKLLVSIRTCLEYGVGNGKQVLASSKEIFDITFGKRLANTFVELVSSSYWRIYNLISKVGNRKERN